MALIGNEHTFRHLGEHLLRCIQSEHYHFTMPNYGCTAINRVRESAVTFINQNTGYTYPTVNRLANYLIGLVADPNWTGDINSHVDQIEAMITQYSNPWPTVDGNAGCLTDRFDQKCRLSYS